MQLFVRNDDVGPLTQSLRSYVELFLRVGIPVSYQIIPARLTAECARYLKRHWRQKPHLIEFGQHGLEHEMVVRGRRLLREFGPERSLEEQTTVIQEGRRRLREALGEDVPIRIFTPPQHKFDVNTLRAVASSGCTILSAAHYPSRRHQAAYGIGRALRLSSIMHHGISYHLRTRPDAPLREVSIAVVVDDGRSIRTPAETLPHAIARAASCSDVVGLMFHHEVYRGRLMELEAIADKMVEHGRDRFVLLSSLANEEN